ncbi:MAG TPA: FMN reductase [Nocardioidaceae bacterium]|nr:FMN reductase [Nocardioidaceae bacterium]
MTTRKLAVVTAGLSQPSSTRLLGDRLAAATQRALTAQGAETAIEVIELRDHAHDLTDNMLTGFPSANLRQAIDGTLTADGLIAVTPIFTASYSGLFKSFFDVLDADALTGKPVLIAATGGTERHSLALEHALRPLFAYLRAVVVPTSVYAASSDWGTEDHGGRRTLGDRIERAGGELADLVGRSTPSGPVDAFATPTPFEQLLGDR